MAEPWRVLVVEDDRDVASLHCRLVAHTPGFDVVGAATTAAQATTMITTLRPDLLLLDLGLPGESGIKLLRWLRASGLSVEVIAVTAAAMPRVVRATFQLGVLDYLVKPFRPDRLRQAMETFDHHARAFSGARMPQDRVDAVRRPAPRLPKDIAADRVEQVEQALRAAPVPVTAAELGGQLGLARSTARRYLEYLVSVGLATVSPLPSEGGRPRNGYAVVARPGPSAPLS